MKISLFISFLFVFFLFFCCEDFSGFYEEGNHWKFTMQTK